LRDCISFADKQFWLVITAAETATESVAVFEGTLTLPCLMGKLAFRSTVANRRLREGEGSTIWTCSVDPIDFGGMANHVLEIVGLDKEQVQGLVSGYTYLIAPGARITGHVVDISSAASVSFETLPQDKAAKQVVGTRKVLVVRVISADGQTPKTLAELSNNVFDDAVNLKERYASCSYGKLNFEKYVGTLNGKSISGGMYEVTIAESTAGQGKRTVDFFVVNQLNTDLGSDFVFKIDHYMIFLPGNVVEFGAYADLPGKKSVYNGNNEASFASVFFVHEVGHNLNLDHSSEGTEEYGDGAFSLHDLTTEYTRHRFLTLTR
jgi:Gametolysin peptidase M11